LMHLVFSAPLMHFDSACSKQSPVLLSATFSVIPKTVVAHSCDRFLDDRTLLWYQWL
jgi:hypothetical protein